MDSQPWTRDSHRQVAAGHDRRWYVPLETELCHLVWSLLDPNSIKPHHSRIFSSLLPHQKTAYKHYSI